MPRALTLSHQKAGEDLLNESTQKYNNHFYLASRLIVNYDFYQDIFLLYKTKVTIVEIICIESNSIHSTIRIGTLKIFLGKIGEKNYLTRYII